MTTKPEVTGSRTCWFVGATYGTEDQTSRFIKDGIWQNGYQNRYLAQVKSIQIGDRIAIKATYTRKRDLPFDNRGQSVSVMAIKAIGIVKKNHGDGRTLDVEWTPFDTPRKWYFYTYIKTIWKIMPGDSWYNDSLIDFTFNNVPQDYDRYRNAPYWRERFGDTSADKRRFLWTRFYEAIADKLLLYRDKRDELIAGIHSIASKVEGLSYLQDQFQNGSTGPLKDICPFTAMGIFNRHISDVNRKNIATELATFLGVGEVVPDSFEGIPILNNYRSWFFGYDKDRGPDDIHLLWEIFARAIAFSESDDESVRDNFISAYDKATKVKQVGFNLTMGLYWIRPWNCPTLDSQSQIYISKKLNIKIGRGGPKGRCNANDYLAVLDTLETRFQEDAYPVHSFPELSLAAWEEAAALGELDKDIRKFKLTCKDFVSFSNPGKIYLDLERSYKDKAVKATEDLFKQLNDDGSNSTEIYLQFIELANFYNWHDKGSIESICSHSDFQHGLNKWFKAIVSDEVHKDIFDEVKTLMKKAGIKANMFLQTMLFPAFLYNPSKYFALKSSYLRQDTNRYGFSVFKKGEYLSYEQFLEIQRFGEFMYESLRKFEPKDMVDIQSFLWIADGFEDAENDMEEEEHGMSGGQITEDETNIAPSTPVKSYTVDDILEDGCFIKRSELEKILKRLQTKKNLILQGPPGTGKTWLAKRLAFALIGQKNDNLVRAVQFHPNLSYEDFVRGWRPSGDGKLALTDGPFVEMIRAAESEPGTKYVIVIEEINRGNPAQIFGEMLTLLEADKRTPEAALKLSYGDDPVHIPANLYVIGTMNIADRSLALVDLALRRRFAFIDLKPALGKAWKEWVQTQCGVATEILDEIGNRILSLNSEITSDSSLGEQFSIGHSYVTPPFGIPISDAREWFRQVVDTEIGPLLDEYWFDSLDKAQKAKEKLLEDF